jgi:dihydroorotate dehydrogenase electron transfer subunit
LENNKIKEKATVASQSKLATGIYDMWIKTTLASKARPGQFISVYPEDKSTLLPRPISICETDKEKGMLRIVYRVAGKGTSEFSTYNEGHNIDILGTLGNGFPIEKAKGKRVFLMGGGIGIPPMLELAKQVGGDIIVGYRNNELFLSDDLAKYGKVHIATEDGSVGTKGNVLDAIKSEGLEGDIIFACGPMPMLRAIKAYAQEKGMEAYISLEERMACGVGACLGCVVKTKEIDHHSHVKNARICTDGPVYNANDVEI